MAQCQGDCDGDEDCAGGLMCKQRDNGESVPGCSGGLSWPQMDYCYDPQCEDDEEGLPPLDSSFVTEVRQTCRNAPGIVTKMGTVLRGSSAIRGPVPQQCLDAQAQGFPILITATTRRMPPNLPPCLPEVDQLAFVSSMLTGP